MNTQWVWRLVQDIICIHIPERLDRKKSMDKVSLELNMNINYFLTQKHPNGGKQGCFESHQQVMRESLQKNLDMCLILEDDIELSSSFSWELLYEVLHFACYSTEPWDILYLGCLPDIFSYNQIHKIGHIYKVRATQTHAYIVHSRFMKRFIHFQYSGQAVDNVFKKTANSFAILPSLFHQIQSTSDVEQNTITAISTFPIKSNVVHSIEFYASSIGISILYLVRVCVAACCIAYVFYSVQKKNKSSFFIELWTVEQ